MEDQRQIVQKVVTEANGINPIVFWEAWEVQNGVVYAGYKKTTQVAGVPIKHAELGGIDTFKIPSANLNMQGQFVRVTGYAKFYEVSINWKLGVQGGVLQSQFLPSTSDPPDFWSDEGSVIKRFQITFTKDVGPIKIYPFKGHLKVSYTMSP